MLFISKAFALSKPDPLPGSQPVKKNCRQVTWTGLCSDIYAPSAAALYMVMSLSGADGAEDQA